MQMQLCCNVFSVVICCLHRFIFSNLTTQELTMFFCAFSSTVPVCVCMRVSVWELIIAAPLVFSGGSSRISLCLSPGWDHRAGIVLACRESAEMGECLSFSSSFLPLCILFHLSFSSLLYLSLPPQLYSVHFHLWWVFPLFLVSLTHSPRPPHLPTTSPPVSLYPSHHPLHPASISLYPPLRHGFGVNQNGSLQFVASHPFHPSASLPPCHLPFSLVSPLSIHPPLSLLKLLSTFCLNSDTLKMFESLSWHRQQMEMLWMCVYVKGLLFLCLCQSFV